MEAEQSLLLDQTKKSRGFAQKLANVGSKLGGGSSYTHKKSVEDISATAGYQASVQSLHDGSMDSIEPPSARHDDSVTSLPRSQLGRTQLQASVSSLEGGPATAMKAAPPPLVQRGVAFGMLEKASRFGGTKKRFFCVRDSMLLHFEVRLAPVAVGSRPCSGRVSPL